MPKHLSDENINKLYAWLKDMQINVQKMHRDFADAAALASLLKKLYPKLIDLHNYPPRNSVQLKLDNWETINHKALLKLNIQQNKSMLKKLAKATPGAIEILLFQILSLQEKSREKANVRAVQEQEQRWSENDEIVIIDVNKKVGDAIVQVPQKMILYSIYEQTVRESHAKDVALNEAEQKITHLENILKLKTERINELCTQVAKQSMRTFSNQFNVGDSPCTQMQPDVLETVEQSTARTVINVPDLEIQSSRCVKIQ